MFRVKQVYAACCSPLCFLRYGWRRQPRLTGIGGVAKPAMPECARRLRPVRAGRRRNKPTATRAAKRKNYKLFPDPRPGPVRTHIHLTVSQVLLIRHIVVMPVLAYSADRAKYAQKPEQSAFFRLTLSIVFFFPQDNRTLEPELAAALPLLRMSKRTLSCW